MYINALRLITHQGWSVFPLRMAGVHAYIRWHGMACALAHICTGERAGVCRSLGLRASLTLYPYTSDPHSPLGGE